MRWTLFLLLLFPFALCAQVRNVQGIRLKDSLGKELTSGWLFSAIDDSAMARLDYDDSRWQRVNPEMPYNKKHPYFKGLGWFRFHFTADTSLTGKPLSISLSHFGASQVYLDGRMLFNTGLIKGRDSSIYLDRQSVPFAFVIPDTGQHILAVRYANWRGLNASYMNEQDQLGFTMRLDKANDRFFSAYFNIWVMSGIWMLLTGIFGTLFFLHLIFFLYNRNNKSNLWFCIFNLCLTWLFITPLLLNTVSNPAITVFVGNLSFLILTAAFYALSASLNALFSHSRIRMRILALLCALVCLVFIFFDDYLQLASMTLISAVSLEAVFLIARAVYLKVPGAKIIGAGLGLLIILLLLVVILSLTRVGINLSLNTWTGAIGFLVLFLAALSIPISLSAYLARSFWAVSRDLKIQLRQVQDLSQKSLEQEAEKQRMLQDRQVELEREVALRTHEVMQQKEEIEHQHVALKREKKKADDLLRNILPEEVAEELKEYGSSAARLYERVTVLFTDFANFTQMSEQLSPESLVREIDHCFKAFDGIVEQYGLEKIKTVGDAYIAVAGLPVSNERHALVVIDAALAIRDFMDERKKAHPGAFNIRLGVHSGPVVAGIVGLKKFAYDIWGDTVNTAARMEQHGEVGRVNVSNATYELLHNAFAFSYRGELEAKHKGKLGMYFVERLTAEVPHITAST